MKRFESGDCSPYIPVENFDYQDTSLFGEAGVLDVVEELQHVPVEEEAIVLPRDPLEVLIEQRPEINPVTFLPEFKADVQFRERDQQLTAADVIHFITHHGDGKTESHQERVAKAQEKGHMEAASYGIGEIKGNRFVLFATHFEFLGGSLGAVMGEKYVRALELAQKRGLPFVAMYATGGARQQENTIALEQMTRMTDALTQFKEETQLPTVSIAIGKTYGGVSAGPFPLSDIVGAMEGADYGFSGPNVISAYEGQQPPEGSQSVEANFANRTIDVLLKDGKAVQQWLGNLFEVTKKRPKKKYTEEDFSVLKQVRRLPQDVRFPFDSQGFFTLDRLDDPDGYQESLERIPPHRRHEEVIFESRSAIRDDKDALFEQFTTLSSNPQRFDTEYLMTFLENPVPLYNGYSAEEKVVFPATIAALGLVGGEQPVIVMGHQPTYYRKPRGGIGKIPSSPGPADFDYVQRVYDMAERMGIPVIVHVDTLGAKPTLAAEITGQSRAIARTIARGNKFKGFTATVISNMGSGGGLALAPWGRRFMFADGTAAVAEPSSAAAIVYKTPSPTLEQKKNTLKALKATAYDQEEFGTIDNIISVGKNEAVEHPERVVARARDVAVQFLIDASYTNVRTELKRRREKIRKSTRKYLHSQPTDLPQVLPAEA